MKKFAFVHVMAVIPLMPEYMDVTCVPNNIPAYPPPWGTCAEHTGVVLPLDDDTPLAPSELVLTAVTTPVSRSVELDWTDNSHNEDGFLIQRKTADTAWETFGTVEADHPYYRNHGAFDRMYSYRVQAFRGALGSAFSNVAGVEETESPAPPLPAPTHLMATPGDDRYSIRLRWTNHAENVTAYEVERAVDLCSGEQTCWEYGFRRIGMAADTCFVDEDVDPAQRADLPYIYRVRAYYQPADAPTEYERSAYSYTASAVPDPQGEEAPRLEVDIRGTGNGQVTATGVGCNSNWCTGVFTPGEVVVLVPVPAADSVLGAWSGCDAVDGDVCTVIMDQSRTVTVTFDRIADDDEPQDDDPGAVDPTLPPPALSGPAEATGWYLLTMSWNWPADADEQDHYVLEYSYDDANYQLLANYHASDFDTAWPLEEMLHPVAADIGVTTYFRLKVVLDGRATPYSNVVGVYCPYIEMYYDATHDNLVQDVSSDGPYTEPPHERDKVFADSELAVGTIWNWDGSYMNAASALRFDGLEHYISGRTIESATLELRPSGEFIPTYFATTFRVNAFQEAWDPNTLTYMTMPGAYQTPYAEVTAASALESPWQIDVGDIVQVWADGTPNHGVLLWDTDMQWHTGNEIAHPGYQTWSLATAFSNDTAPTEDDRPVLYLVIRERRAELEAG